MHYSFRPWAKGLSDHPSPVNPSQQSPSSPGLPKIVIPSSPNPRATPKAYSTTQLPTMGTAATGAVPHDRSRSDNLDFNTLSRSPTPLSNGNLTPPSASSHHPDLSNEVAALSTKLINAINHQTDLDDSLQSTRSELEAARNETQRLRQEVEEEKKKRVEAEEGRRKLESEVDDLTQQLFVEAQNMVTSARRENDEAEQKNEQLKGQLKDAETLLASHQQQLRELKDMLQQNEVEHAPSEASVHPSAPSTPVVGPTAKATVALEQSSLPAQRVSSSHTSPEHPLSFSHLITPVLRTDLQAYEDFVAMLEAGRKTAPSSRANSGNFAGLNVMGIGSLSNFRQSTVTKPSLPSGTSTSSLTSSAPAHQHIPGSFNNPSPIDATASPTIASSLKDQKFYKRAVQEDIEPTLRLETAPGLSFFSKRNVISSMASGNLFVEPYGPSSKYWSSSYSCALCGEERNEEPYIRKHRFRTSDSDDAQRYMVCDYCLGRLQATGDFVNFLRMVRSGYWKSESTEDARLAWEECTKLREKMFWARLGGGVVPNQPFSSVESISSPRRTRNTGSWEDAASEASASEAAREQDVDFFQPRDVTRVSRASIEHSPVRRPAAGMEAREPFAGSASFRAARNRFETSLVKSNEPDKRSPSRPGTAPTSARLEPRGDVELAKSRSQSPQKRMDD